MSSREVPSYGFVMEIYVSPQAATLPYSVSRAFAMAGRGLEGDRYSADKGTWSDYHILGGKNLTLIEAEALDALGLGAPASRRNIVTRGVRLNNLVGRQFRIGAVECYGNRLCDPCRHLEQLTGVPVAALMNKGGLRADILSSGEILVGSPLTPSV
jgi:MOSC domain-containing protein YiiM